MVIILGWIVIISAFVLGALVSYLNTCGYPTKGYETYSDERTPPQKERDMAIEEERLKRTSYQVEMLIQCLAYLAGLAMLVSLAAFWVYRAYEYDPHYCEECKAHLQLLEEEKRNRSIDPSSNEPY